MTKFITITSGKGGVGKTTTAINLATALNSLGKDAIVVDANLTTPNVNIHLGAPRLPKTLHDALRGDIKLIEAVYKHKGGLKVIPASISLEDLRTLDMDRFKHILKDLEGKTDLVILDSGAGLGKEGIMSIEAADEVLVVTNPDLPSVAGAMKAVKVSRDVGKLVLGALVTKVSKDKFSMKDREIEKLLDVPVIGHISYDENIRKALRLKNPVLYTHPNTKASRQYRLLASTILGEKYDYGIVNNWFLRLLRSLGFKVKKKGKINKRILNCPLL